MNECSAGTKRIYVCDVAAEQSWAVMAELSMNAALGLKESVCDVAADQSWAVNTEL